MSKFVLIVSYIDGPKQFLRSLLVVNKLAYRDDTGVQYFVPEEDHYNVFNIH